MKVNSDGKVKIASNANTSYSTLLVGNKQFGTSSTNVGISGSKTVVAGKNNIGVMGAVSGIPSITNGTNYGFFGVVCPVNYSHGRNYGLCGMIEHSGTGDHYGGAGIYGTNFTYYFNNPTNIQGDYAGYFAGAVKVTGNITTQNVFIPTDSRLNENVESLNERGGERYNC